MKRFLLLSVTLCLIITGEDSLIAGYRGGKDVPRVVTTFECAGFYWALPESGPCQIRYRQLPGNSWFKALDLAYDGRDGEYRGSLVGLKPDTEYEAELTCSSMKQIIEFRTRNDNFPIGKTTMLLPGESDKPVIITESGSPSGYHLITVPEGNKSVLNMENVSANGIEVDADYVIIRGVEIRNAAVNGIFISSGHHDVVVEQCHITFWGRIGGPGTYGNLEGGYDSGIFADDGTYNLTIQRNLIDDPRGASNDWEAGHPDGPQGVSVFQSNGGNVIRYNDIVSSEDHGYNDGIGGGENYSKTGNMNKDSDIYGNIIRNVWDDAIESEGANMNVRIWGNYIHFFFNGIATAATSRGPLYIFRNVAGESRRGHLDNTGGAFIKTGESELYGGGRRYVFHNTIVQPSGVLDVFTSHPNPNCITRNNIFDARGRLATDRTGEPASDYDYDYFSGSTRGKSADEQHSVRFNGTPSGSRLFIPSYSLEFYLRSTVNSIKWGAYQYEFGDRKVTLTDPVVWIKNPLIDGGVVIPGFNDGYTGTAPDLGAFETARPPLQFGRRAYLSWDAVRAPWETY
jgi:hypothetical protein